MKHSIDVVPEGWWALRDANAFFPEDLPKAWRLTYFANSFPAVMVPADAWLGRSASDLANWQADVHAGFRFYLDCPEMTGSQAVSHAIHCLGSALAGFVRTPRCAGVGDRLASQMLTVRDVAGFEGEVLRGPRHLNADLRAARVWLSALVGEPRLVILDRPTAPELSAWWDLITLMGLT
ncbi:MAG: hypothetical protein WBG92_07990 [Thiohalocapsa sp.]